ncbi:hypothetical protein [Microbacterium sp.]|uniref:hypothetical protein n=1 Tax=Microbacterium sp. TaxID=51671 RepID=UPI003F9BCA88
MMQQLRSAAKRSGRASVALPREFARDTENPEPEPPLVRILRGKGETRLKVYLTTLMAATRAPHATQNSAYTLATTLGLGESRGARRRIDEAYKGLVDLNLVARELNPGAIATTTVLHWSGKGEQWEIPTPASPYISLPIELWRNGWIVALSGRAIAMLIVLRELTNGRSGDSAWADGTRKAEYGLSADTWTRGCAELESAGLLTMSTVVASSHGLRRRRKSYTLHIDNLKVFEPGQH